MCPHRLWRYLIFLVKEALEGHLEPYHVPTGKAAAVQWLMDGLFPSLRPLLVYLVLLTVFAAHHPEQQNFPIILFQGCCQGLENMARI